MGINSHLPPPVVAAASTLSPPLLQSFKALDLPFSPLELEALWGFEGGDLDQHFHQSRFDFPLHFNEELVTLGFFGTLAGRSCPPSSTSCLRAWWAYWEPPI
jgi:hypothetical protein